MSVFEERTNTSQQRDKEKVGKASSERLVALASFMVHSYYLYKNRIVTATLFFQTLENYEPDYLLSRILNQKDTLGHLTCKTAF